MMRPLTKDFKTTIMARVQRDPEFREEMPTGDRVDVDVGEDHSRSDQSDELGARWQTSRESYAVWQQRESAIEQPFCEALRQNDVG